MSNHTIHIHMNKRQKTILRETSIVPRDVVFDILKKLSVKDLLRFKCVSKDWFSLINDPYFIKLHLNESMETAETNNSISIVLKHATSGKLFCAVFDYVNVDNPSDLNHPFTHEPSRRCVKLNCHEYVVDNTGVVGSCNGLICLVNETYKTIVLWNMSTGDCKFLPNLPVDGKVSPKTFYGFGYDSITDDYKVVRIVQQRQKIGEVMVYSRKKNAWSRCSSEEIPNNCYIVGFNPTWKRGGATLLGGALHWVVNTSSGYSSWIMAFDVGSEKYKEIELPNHLKEIDQTSSYVVGMMDLRVLGGCLCMFSTGSPGSYVLYNELWTMKEYGMKESWTLLFRVVEEYRCLLYPLAYSKNYDEILLDYYWSRIRIQGDRWIHIIPPLVNMAQLRGGGDCKYLVHIPLLEKHIRPFFSEICMGSFLQLGD